MPRGVVANLTRKGRSEYHGLDHVRCTKARAAELLHGVDPIS